MKAILRQAMALAVVGFALRAPAALACAACYGKSDSPLAAGMNWGIYVLLGFISMVLVGIAGIGVYFVKRAATNPLPTPTTTPDSNPQS